MEKRGWRGYSQRSSISRQLLGTSQMPEAVLGHGGRLRYSVTLPQKSSQSSKRDKQASSYLTVLGREQRFERAVEVESRRAWQGGGTP